MKSFDGKVAAITGAGSGIGRGIALALAKRGCHLSLSDVNEVGLAETADLAARSGVKVTKAKVDVAQRDRVFAWAEATVKDHGGANLVFNNAGVAHSSSVERTTLEDFTWIMNINFWGVVHGTQAFLPHLHASGDGHVINISSVFGLVGVVGQSTYNATKFAVRGYTEALRQELAISGANVSATCVHPGGIRTNIARAARVDDAALGDVGMKEPAKARAEFDKMLRISPDDAAETILRGVRRNAPRVLIGPEAYVIDIAQRLMPAAYQRIAVAFMRRSF
jgi:short-subunit dehydrogenase